MYANSSIIDELRDHAAYLAELSFTLRMLNLDADEVEERAERLLRVSVELAKPILPSRPRTETASADGADLTERIPQ